MAIAADIVGKVPPGNVHVSRRDFGEVWSAAEELLPSARPGAGLDFVQGVVDACRWVAGSDAVSALVGRLTVPPTPTRGEVRRAMPEDIEREYFGARRARDRARRLATSSGGSGDREHAVVVTLEWLWFGGPPPVDDDLRMLVEAL